MMELEKGWSKTTKENTTFNDIVYFIEFKGLANEIK